MELINGKFFKNGKEVRVEIGNPEQIKLFQLAEIRFDKAKKGELQVSYDFHDELCRAGEARVVDFGLNCVCGWGLTEKKMARNDMDIYCYPNEMHCQICKRDYTIRLCDWELMANLKTNDKI